MSAIDAVLVNQPGTGRENSFARRLMRRPSGLLALIYLALLVVVAIAAPLIAPDNPSAQDLFHTLSGPSSAHLLAPIRSAGTYSASSFTALVAP